MAAMRFNLNAERTADDHYTVAFKFGNKVHAMAVPQSKLLSTESLLRAQSFPGLGVRSVEVKNAGRQLSQSSRCVHASPLRA